MKTRILTIVCLVCAGVLAANAQVKKRPAAKRPAATAAKKPAAAKVNNKFAILQLDEWIKHELFEDEENIYFLGISHSENALRALNKKTGDIKLVVPKKRRARPQICCAGSDGKNIYMRLEDKGIIRFNGTDVNTSEMILKQGDFLSSSNRGSKIITSPDGRYVSLAGDGVLVYDTVIKRVIRNNGKGTYNSDGSLLMLNDGTVIKTCPSSLVFIKPQLIPLPEANSMSKNNLMNTDEYDIRKIGNGGGGEVREVIYDQVDTVLYASFGEQVLKTRADKIAWTEAYCLPGENKKFMHIAVFGNHAIGETDNYEKHFYLWDSKDFTGQPTILKELDTEIGTPQKWTGLVNPEKVSNVQHFFTDSMSNLWIQVDDGRFVIYNPDGIKGLTSLIGKVTENKLPEDD